MQITDLRIEYRKNPIGIDILRPRFSWKLESEQTDTMQTAYQIQVISGGEMIWDSGCRKSDQSVLVEYEGLPLQAEAVYEYRAIVWDNHGEMAEAGGNFETGLLAGTAFQAQWITHSFEQEETACPVFTKTVNLAKPVKRARIYATALGTYEIQINGKKVGDTFFAPGWTNYKKRLQYQTYDVTEFLADETGSSKESVIEVIVGNGWYKGIFGFTCTPNHYGDRVAALAELHVEYEDGSKEVVATDTSWQVKTGPIRYSEIYMGETIDSTFSADQAVAAEAFSYPMENIIAQESEPVRITKRTVAKELIVTPKGEKVLDFGQNMAGIVEVKVQGKSGQKIVIRHAETLDKDGNFYSETLRQAKSIDTYICDGTEQTFLPHFTFHGFRYICVEGLDEVNPADFTACTLHTDMKETGSFSCSNEMVNQLQSNIQWGQRGNFLDIPTDCPQRDERLGWTGDAQVFCRTASYNMETALFFRKWLHDLKSEQSDKFGPPHVVPNILQEQDAAAAWSDAATVIPWTVYQVFGDKRVLEEQYESMKGYVDYITAHCSENGLWQTGFQYGDWLALDKEESADRTGATDKYLVANAYYAYSADIVSKAAQVLGYEEDAKEYETLHQKIVELFDEEYITRTGRVVSETQTGCILALYFNLAQEKYRERIAGSLETNIANHKNHLSTGFVGTPYLCHVLSENGMHDLAGTIFLKEDYPSWLYAVKKGATTIWERWNSIMPDGSFDESGMNSLNHYAYGSIGDWMYEKLAGINPVKPGYKEILIKPMFIKGITSVDASFDSVYGVIRSAWSCKEGKITVDVTIPANTTAEVFLPEKEEALHLGSGCWHYEYETDTKLELDRFTMDTTLGALVQEPLAVEMFNQYMPGMLDGPMIKFAYGMTVSELTATMPPEGAGLFKMVLDALNRQ
ncbi:MAG: glycoside hydrolase family 78 protein [Lachnospiraceae bacterium]|nr:glycoside hydrolase family 78 protein [Lachnospiraceae bacterium]